MTYSPQDREDRRTGRQDLPRSYPAPMSEEEWEAYGIDGAPEEETYFPGEAYDAEDPVGAFAEEAYDPDADIEALPEEVYDSDADIEALPEEVYDPDSDIEALPEEVYDPDSDIEALPEEVYDPDSDIEALPEEVYDPEEDSDPGEALSLFAEDGGTPGTLELPEKEEAEGFASLDLSRRRNARTPGGGSGGDEPPRKTRFAWLTPRRKNRNFFLSVLLTTVILLAVLLAAVGVAGAGAVIGIARAYVATTPELDLARIEDQSETSFLYDKNGDLITTISGMENRIWVAYDEIPKTMIDAIVSIEDRRFYSHEGIDIKRIVGAFVSNLSSSSTQGGSTITQQLIKMRILNPEQTYKRKLQEAYLALELEKKYSKEDILEAYLNTIFLGQSNYGIKTAAMDYFGKELDQLSIRECAMLAGLAQSPYTYDPRRNYYVKDRFELTNMRTDRVLNAMFETGCITEAEYEAALAEDVHIIEESTANDSLSQMPYYVEFAVENVIDHMLRSRGLDATDSNRSLIERELRTGGYHIYTTLDPALQTAAQSVVYNYEDLPEMASASDASAVLRYDDGTSQTITQPQASVTVVENGTGYLAAIIGGTYEPRVARATNRAWQTRMPIGSSIKPIAVYAPALEAGLTPGSVVYNIPAEVTGWGTERGYPNNYGGGGFTGATTVRTALYKSLNVVAARLLMDSVGVAESADYLARMGIASDKVNRDGPGLALGTSGISTMELAGAFSTFPNGGEYIEPVAFTRILDGSGQLILDVEDTRIRNKVFSGATAYMMTDLLTGAVKSGTGSRAKVDGITTGGKTGTNSDARGVSFAGFTHYYSAAVWIGSDYYKPLYSGAQGGRNAAPLFKAVMDELHSMQGLEDAPVLDADPESLGLEKAEYCSVTGLLATDLCREDAAGLGTHKDWFVRGVTSDRTCDVHQSLRVCSETGLLAGAYCPEELRADKGVIIIDPENDLARFPEDVLSEYLPGVIFGEIPPDLTDLRTYNAEFVNYADQLCAVHTKEWKENMDAWKLLYNNCASLRLEAMNRLADLNIWDLVTAIRLQNAITALDKAMDDPTCNVDNLQMAYDNLLTLYYNLPPVYEGSPDDPGDQTDPTGGEPESND